MDQRDADRRKDVREFLASRRARLAPEQVGLPRYGDRRRVKGLRREEVATLAGVSVDYYARLERGNLAGVSDSVLACVAEALRLDEAERQHLADLARAAAAGPTGSGAPRRRTRTSTTPRPAVLTILAGLTTVPAYVRNARGDILAANDLCRALYAGVLDDERLPLNLGRFVFLDPRSRGLFVDWEDVADGLAASLRVEVGRNPHDRALSDLVGELSTRSDAFVARWARQDVRLHRTARKQLHNPVVGDVELTGDALELTGDGLTLVAYTAQAGSPAEDQLRLLATWDATRRATAAASAVPPTS